MSAAARAWRAVEAAARAEAGPTLRVLTWNVLADGLAQHGGFVRASPDVLTWESRWPRILRFVREQEADVVCLQEASHYDDAIGPALAGAGFASLFVSKSSPANETIQEEADGCVLAWRRAHLDLLWSRALYYRSGAGADSAIANQRAILATLRDTRTGALWVVCTTHLKAKPSGAAARAEQIRQALDATAAAVERARAWPGEGGDGDEEGAEAGAAPPHVGVLLCGDFNEHPRPDPDAVWGIVASHALGLRSAYSPEHWVPGATETPDARIRATESLAFTTWKFRPRPGGDGGRGGDARGDAAGARPGEHEKQECIDYVWVGGGARPSQCLGLPTAQSIGPDALPNAVHPSDHLPLVVDLTVG